MTVLRIPLTSPGAHHFELQTCRALFGLASIFAAVGGTMLLLSRTYIVEHCFRRADFGGCSYDQVSYGAAVVVSPLGVLLPSTLVLVLVGAAVLASLDPRRAAFALGAYALTVPGLTAVAGLFCLPASALVLVAYVLARTRSVRAAIVPILAPAALIAAAVVVVWAVELVWVRIFSGLPGNVFETYGLLAGAATSVGLVVGAGLAERQSNPGRLVTGLAAAYTVLAAASIVAAVAAIPLLYPNGTYVKSAAGLGGVAAAFWVTGIAGTFLVSAWVSRRELVAWIPSAILSLGLFVSASALSWIAGVSLGLPARAG